MENVWKSNKADKRIKENSEILRNKNNKCLFSYLCMYISYINCAVNIGLRGKKSLFYILVSAVAIFKWIYSHLKNKVVAEDLFDVNVRRYLIIALIVLFDWTLPFSWSYGNAF